MFGMENYEKLISRISSSSGVDAAELDRKVEAKRAKLSGLVSKEGAAQIVAAELGINLDKERLKISELVNGMRRANVVGKIVSVSPIREFNKNGREGKVCNMLFADDSSNTRVVLWDTNHISLIETGKLKEGDVIEISNGNVRNGELHLGSFSDVKKSTETMDSVVTEKVYSSKSLSDAKAGESMKTRAIIVQMFEPRYFEVCPTCRKKATDGQCAEHGSVSAEKRALVNVVLDDGSETIRSVMFGENINKIGLTDEQIFDLEKFNVVKDGFLGEERFFSGNLRSNALYNTTEFVIDGVEEVSVEELVKELEAKA